ncbi:MAG: YifB family Mg chelatase-like AAA ATPase, partial [Clostridia bacterium]|nr:YifB family Mg chelatase-like AAA ATPase [Clostridia bacterium]
MAIIARDKGIKNIIVPKANALEAGVVDGINVFPATDLYSVVKHLTGEQVIEPVSVNVDEIFSDKDVYELDFADVKGQESVKRAVEVAVAGGHNILMIGSPGSGKSMIAKRIPSILPAPTFQEALETTKIHSIAGVLPENISILKNRVFRSPHHSVSAVGLVGGGTVPKPGEISLAHNGVLFLDELPEFTRQSLEVMRQPLEDGKITIARVNASYTFPANVLFVASMNPCKCGYFGDAKHRCTCSPNDISKYVGKISGPLLDRIDIHIDVPAVQYDMLQDDEKAESSADIRERVQKAREIQSVRFKDERIFSNSQMTPSMIRKYCAITDDAKEILKTAFESLGLSARAHDRILKVARTIADLEGREKIDFNHIAEAIGYRSLDRKYWLQ